tara:strand:+ start:581 stop:1342 length:762 start_codon:yes stop_codon:yes gene_type:complete
MTVGHQRINKIYSPNYDNRFKGTEVRFLILHYTACDFETALKYLTRESEDNPVSAHYLIDVDGRIVQLVDEEKRAWHAGISQWGTYQNLNTWSIGIELVNMGHELGYTAFPELQMQSLIMLSHTILRRHPIPPQHVLGHSDIAPLRKRDPGELLDWRRLAREGIGLQPKTVCPSMPFDPYKARILLNQIGYDIDLDGTLDEKLIKVLKAFCMRCAPKEVSLQNLHAIMGILKEYNRLQNRTNPIIKNCKKPGA